MDGFIDMIRRSAIPWRVPEWRASFLFLGRLLWRVFRRWLATIGFELTLVKSLVLRSEDFQFRVGLFERGFDRLDLLLRATFQMSVAKLVAVGI